MATSEVVREMEDRGLRGAVGEGKGIKITQRKTRKSRVGGDWVGAEEKMYD